MPVGKKVPPPPSLPELVEGGACRKCVPRAQTRREPVEGGAYIVLLLIFNEIRIYYL
jgi:hypothetical protein